MRNSCEALVVVVSLALVVPVSANAATALFDFQNGDVQAGWAEVINAGTGSSGPVTISTTAVGSSLDNRDRGATANGGGAESEMWRDFLFANGSNVPGEGLDLNLTGLAANTTYPVRLWSFDESSNNGRGATWNGHLSTFPSSPDPATLNDYVAKFNITSDGAGNAAIQGRVYADNGQPHHVFVNGLEIGDPLPAAPTPPTYAIDIDSTTSGPMATAPGFTSLDATQPSNDDSVTVGGTTFTVFSAGGSRSRATGNLPFPNQLTGDFVYDDGGNAAVGLRVYDLPAAWYEAKVWAWDQTAPAGNQIVGITRFVSGGETIFTTNFPGSATDPYTFVFNSAKLPDGFGIFSRENNSANRSRFNALTLTPVASPLHPDHRWNIDIDVGTPQTEPGWTSLPVSGSGGTVFKDGVTFSVFSADGSRDRGGPNDLARDFVFDDGGGQAVGLRIWDLPDGKYEAKVWAWDDSFPTTVGDQIVGITQFGAGSEIIFTDSFAPSAADPFTFLFDSSDLPDGFGIFTRENNTANRARFNALQLTLVPEPATMALVALAFGAVGLRLRRRRMGERRY